MKKIFTLLILFIVLHSALLAQKDVTTFGIQFKPIIPSKFFNSGVETIEGESFNVTKTPKLGYNFGMVIRKGITDIFSLELGINYTRRRFDLEVIEPVDGISKNLNFIFTAYEIPVQGLVYVQLGDELWMNAAAGFSMDMYPSDLFSSDSQDLNGSIYDFEQRTYRSNWLQFALVANYGFEWRTEEDGIFYVGASYHRPFSDMATTEITFKKDNFPYREKVDLSGSYLTLDLRYFFHEDPQRKKKTKKKESLN